MLITIVLTIGVGILAMIGAVLLTPFPYWPTYFRIWYHLLFDPEPSIGFKDRRKQALYLFNYVVRLSLIHI